MNALKEGLAALAQEVRVVNLHQKVLLGSRRIARRNRAITSAAAAIAVTGVLVAVEAWRAPLSAPSGTEPSASASPSTSMQPTESAQPTESSSPSASSPTPTSATTSTPASPGAVDLNNTELEVVIPVGRGIGQVTNGRGQVYINVLYDLWVISWVVLPDSGTAVAILEIRHGQGTPLRQIHLYKVTNLKVATLLDKQLADFALATKVEASGADLKVTDNGRVRTFKRNAGTGVWEEIR